MTNYTAMKKLQKEQDKLCKSIPQKYQKAITRIINIEYKLTMLEEGHSIDTIGM